MREKEELPKICLALKMRLCSSVDSSVQQVSEREHGFEYRQILDFCRLLFCNAKFSVHLRRSFPCLIVFYVFVVLPEAQIPCQTFCRLHPELNTCNVDNLSPDLEEKHLAYQLGQLVQLLTKSNNKNISSSFEITIIRRQHVYHPARSANNDFCSTFELCNLMKKTVMTKKINGEDFSEENQQTFR